MLLTAALAIATAATFAGTLLASRPLYGAVGLAAFALPLTSFRALARWSVSVLTWHMDHLLSSILLVPFSVFASPSPAAVASDMASVNARQDINPSLYPDHFSHYKGF